MFHGLIFRRFLVAAPVVADTITHMNDELARSHAVAALLRHGREDAGLTKAAAAAASGMSEGRWRQLEKGTERKGGVEHPASTSVPTLARMAAAVNLDVGDLLAAAGYPRDAADGVDLALPRPQPDVRTVDVSQLSETEVDLVEAFIAGLVMRGRITP